MDLEKLKGKTKWHNKYWELATFAFADSYIWRKMIDKQKNNYPIKC